MYKHKKLYVYDLPLAERKDLCRILDQNDKWEELAGKWMMYDILTIGDLRREVFRGRSPTEELLTLWGHQNHTVLELFVLLSRMHHYQAMTKIKKFVDPEYHVLIDEGERNPNVLLRNLKLDESKAAKMQQENAENNEKILNVEKKEDKPLEPENMSCEDNENVPASPNNLKPKSSERNRAPSVSEYTSVAESARAVPHIPYEELQESTKDWNPKNILGKGGFGTVFKGKDSISFLFKDVVCGYTLVYF